MFDEYKEMFDTFEVDLISRIRTTVFDARISLVTCIFNRFRRALSEVGAIIIVGEIKLHKSYDDNKS